MLKLSPGSLSAELNAYKNVSCIQYLLPVIPKYATRKNHQMVNENFMQYLEGIMWLYFSVRYKATLYPCPDSPEERQQVAVGVISRLQDLETVSILLQHVIMCSGSWKLGRPKAL